jgi:hypothetical protein
MTAPQIAAVVHLVALVVAVISVALALYHAWGMLTHIKAGRHTMANLLGAFAPLAASIFDEEGLAHRRSLSRLILVAALAAAVGIGTALYLGRLPNG